MANVEAYKCDICGKVYHKEDKGEDYTCIVRMDFSGTKESDEDYKADCVCYDDICPECACEIGKVIADPGIIKKYVESNSEYIKKLSAFSQMLIKMIQRVSSTFYAPACIPSLLDERRLDPEYYEGMVDAALVDNDDRKKTNAAFSLENVSLKNSLAIWKKTGIASLIGFVVLVIVGFIFG